MFKNKSTAALLIAVVYSYTPSQLYAAEKVELDVACFQGGYGIDFFEKCAREYETGHPDVKVNIQGNPRIWEQLVPRFASNKVPDLCWPGQQAGARLSR